MQSSEGSQTGRVKRAALTAAMAAIVAAGLVAVTSASPPSGVTPTLLARGTYDSFKVSTDPRGELEFKAKAKSPVDVVVRRHDYAPGSHTGWHSHPGPVFITVTAGELTYYLRDDPECTPHVAGVGEGIVDDGSGHIVRNESSAPAQDMSVILAPETQAFRGELDAPGPHCGF
jgi:oxalate decarboxylase/phosphoglucose isomerase-like protein (cupin superfamily)